MNAVRNVRPGMRARSRSTSLVMWALSPRRRMRFSRASVLGCKGMSRYLGIVCCQGSGFRDDGLDRPAPLLPAHERDGAERAVPIAALRDLDVRGMRLAEPQPRRQLVVQIGRGAGPHPLGPSARTEEGTADVRDAAGVSGADDAVQLRQRLEQFALVALGQAAGGEQDRARPRFFPRAVLDDAVGGRLVGFFATALPI